MIASIYFANEETSWENKQRIMMYMCCTVGVEGMDWGQAGEKRKQLLLLCYIWSRRTWLVWESRALCCRFAWAPAEQRSTQQRNRQISVRLSWSRITWVVLVWLQDEMRWLITENGVPAVLLPLSPDRAQLIPTPVDRRIQTCQQRRTARRIGVKPSARHNCSSTGRRYSRVHDVLT